MKNQNIPVIDLSTYFNGGDREKLQLGMEIDKACREVGFFTIHGHGIDRKIFQDAYDSLKEFFALSIEEKNKLRTDIQPCAHQKNGYSALLEENAHAFMGRKGMPSDYVEKFSMGRSVLDDHLPLPFPDGDFGVRLREHMKAYYKACEKLTGIVTELFAIALDLPRDFFVSRIDHSFDFLRFQNYPGFHDDLINRQGCAGHTDGNLLTILTATGPGLQVKCTNGEWIDVEIKELDHFVVNIGDLMMRWSNDEWLSTEHRVVLTDKSRQSIVFFKLVNDETMIETFPKFTNSKGSKYPTVSFLNYVKGKMQALLEG